MAKVRLRRDPVPPARRAHGTVGERVRVLDTGGVERTGTVIRIDERAQVLRYVRFDDGTYGWYGRSFLATVDKEAA
jgi:hypothetical protein